ncbi:NAD-dependent epimerase/dehydratase family protein [Candidatus Falkowbacteria bacterium]|nr:NAD-dependent epimerase/dehydratase family protein [Candidatus Falkowbacteria bacterium]NCT55140.1 NAD-dependent epimerase/dehydratase family protein [Candidatus Falkowbacteria bacterium]
MSKQVIFDKKNVIVAGGAGFIGSHLCDELIKTCKVICIDDFISGNERNIDHLLANPDFIFLNHDLSTPIDLENIEVLKRFKIEFQGIQEIYNLACPMSPKRFLENRLGTILANSYVVKNLLDLTIKYNSKMLHFSSSVVYGPRHEDDTTYKAKETDIGLIDHLSLRGSYDEGKRFAETMVFNYRDIFKIDARIIRLFRIYGPRMEADDDQMIPDFINNALDGKDLVIAGSDEFSSSFCYIEDALDGIFKFMNSNLSGPINIGSDVDIRMLDFVRLIIEETKSTSKITYEYKKLFFSELILPDIHLARNELSWMPVVTLENGIRKTIFDIEAHKKLKNMHN